MTATAAGDGPALEIRGLTVEYDGRTAVRDVDLTVPAGRLHGLVGESGSGKSTIARAVLGLDRANATTHGEVVVAGHPVSGTPERERRRLRGEVVGYVPQTPFSSLHPVQTVRRQFAAVARAHGRRFSAAELAGLLGSVGVAEPERVLDSYPHQLSGGTVQRVVLTLAFCLSPRLVVADEPTTGLDLTVQRQVMDLLADRAAADGAALLLVTHDLGLVSQYCDTVTVLHGGRVVEQGPVSRVVPAPEHPYTQRLLAAVEAVERTESTTEPTTEPITGSIEPAAHDSRGRSR